MNRDKTMGEPWHLDKRVPIALITTICLQSAAAIWWASSITEQVNTQQKAIDKLTLDGTISSQSVIRMEENIKEINRTLIRLDNNQERLTVLLQEVVHKRNDP